MDDALKKNNYNAGVSWETFVGNHCHKYFQPSITHIFQSVEVKTLQLSDNVKVQTEAHDTASKHQILNELFARVHKRNAPALPNTEEEINNLDSDIIKYMDFYRSDIAKQKIIPKQHILECHSTDFIRLWKFGLLGFLVSRE